MRIRSEKQKRKALLEKQKIAANRLSLCMSELLDIKIGFLTAGTLISRQLWRMLEVFGGFLICLVTLMVPRCVRNSSAQIITSFLRTEQKMTVIALKEHFFLPKKGNIIK